MCIHEIFTDKFQGDSGSQAGMTRPVHHTIEESNHSYCHSRPDQAEGDVKDTVY